MDRNRFMRILLFFDLPTETSKDKREYRKFVKFLISEGFIRIQFSVYCKLCINSNSARTISKRIKSSSPKGDVRYIIISEQQYQDITNINDSHSLNEMITTTDRILVIGGMNDDN